MYRAGSHAIPQIIAAEGVQILHMGQYMWSMSQVWEGPFTMRQQCSVVLLTCKAPLNKSILTLTLTTNMVYGPTSREPDSPEDTNYDPWTIIGWCLFMLSSILDTSIHKNNFFNVGLAGATERSINIGNVFDKFKAWIYDHWLLTIQWIVPADAHSFGYFNMHWASIRGHN